LLVPQNFEAKIGFATLRELLEQLCLSALGRQHVANMQFITQHEQLSKLLAQTDEFRQLLAGGSEARLRCTVTSK
jgi:DNA mismatch repair protein MutS2